MISDVLQWHLNRGYISEINAALLATFVPLEEQASYLTLACLYDAERLLELIKKDKGFKCAVCGKEYKTFKEAGDCEVRDVCHHENVEYDTEWNGYCTITAYCLDCRTWLPSFMIKRQENLKEIYQILAD
jgi:hypothetical protein